MDTKQENKVGMFNKVRAFFASNLSRYSDYPVLTGTIASFNSTIDAILKQDGIATEDSTGYTDQKNRNRSDIASKAVIAAGALMALGSISNNLPLREMSYQPESHFKVLKDIDALILCIAIKQLLIENADALVPYGVDGAFITNYNLSLNKYSKSLGTAGEKKAVKVAAGKEVDKLMLEADRQLNGIIDPIITSSNTKMYTLFTQYQNVRLIDDQASGISTPDFREILEPGTFKVITTLPYTSTRGFKVKNKGMNPINWGLSTAADAFTNAIQVINSKSTSTKLSATLGKLGDILLMHNPTDIPISIEVSVIK
jgi:hypothetical protein